MKAIRVPEATGTGKERVVNLDGSRYTGQQGRPRVAFSNVDIAESTNNPSTATTGTQNRAIFGTASTKNKAIFCDYSPADPAAHAPDTKARDILDRTLIFSILIALIGVAVSAAFLGLGLRGADSDKRLQFERQASEIIKAVEGTWNDFEVAGLWIHEKCRSSADQKDTRLPRGICSREDFLELYEYLLHTGLEFEAIAWVPNVTHVERAILEEASRTYYEDNLPELNYRGFVGLQPDPNAISGLSLQPRDPQPFYFPTHYVAPLSGANLGALDLDLVESPSEWIAIKSALSRTKPSLTGPLRLPAATDMNHGCNVAMMHPGFPLLNSADSEALAVSMMVISVTTLLDRAITAQEDRLGIYLFDATGNATEESADFPVFLGGALSDPGNTKFTTETDLSVLRDDARRLEEGMIYIADRKWIVAVVPTDGTYTPEILFVTLGSAFILVAFICLASWFYAHIAQATKMDQLIVTAKAENAALIVDNAEQAAIVERELNDFIAHEVRNPLTAAISACSFVDTEVNMSSPLVDEESRRTVREDIGIISNSLQFIDDLLRNMLDMHRATSNQMHIEMAPTDLLRDVLEPVATMLHRRGDAFEVIVDCEKNLIVQTDRMRLKQIILNLANNSRKFVQKGFIRLSACAIDGTVKLHVDDSGPGIPMEKRKNLFVKFQESLDSLNQGTGIGLSLSKNLAVLMNGDIWLDEDFDSGVEGFQGTRFVIDLNTAPLNFDSNALDAYELSNADGDGFGAPAAQGGVDDSAPDPDRRQLPEKLSVLFVDDDFVLRKLFSRSIRKLAPEWTLTEAANGETALRLVASQEFDLIFMDQYMASVEKQLLGSEATRALRAKGVTSVICGLSANDTRDTFIKAGADDFIMKPFPCKKDALTRMLLRTLDSREEKPMADRTLESFPQELTPTPILE